MHKRSLLKLILSGVVPVNLARPASAAVQVLAYRQPGCDCCEQWSKHMNDNGFVVAMRDDPELDKRHAEAAVPARLAGCHIAYIDGYIFEGHVPAEDIILFLAERPNALGLAVPGMPAGSPGMEINGASASFDVLMFKKDGSTVVYASHHPA